MAFFFCSNLPETPHGAFPIGQAVGYDRVARVLVSWAGAKWTDQR